MKPILIDLDGVLRSGNNVLPGIETFLSALEKIENPKIILSNSTLNSAKDMIDFFEMKNINIRIPIITAADASLDYIKERYTKVAVYAVDKVKCLFEDYLDFENPQAILVGDLDKEWNYQIMNEIFRFIMDGRDFIAMQKNKFWTTPVQGILLDAGAFIKGLEYASGNEALLLGKPSPEYFKSALKKMNCNENDKFIMIGDDVINDMKGAKNLGADTILIYTGKTKYPVDQNEKQFIDYEVQNLTDLSKLILQIV